jgi:hypothetical protein
MVDVSDDGDVAEIHVASSKVGQWLERDLAGKPGPTFPDRAQNLELKGAWRPKRKPGQKDRAHLTRCGAIYSEIVKKQWVDCTKLAAGWQFVRRSLSQLAGFRDIRDGNEWKCGA